MKLELNTGLYWQCLNQRLFRSNGSLVQAAVVAPSQARFGLGLAVARFINGYAAPDMVKLYRKNFQPSASFNAPHALLAIQVLCADTEEKAVELRKAADYVLLQFEKGHFEPIGGFQEIKDYQFSPMELERIMINSGRVVSGTPESVRAQLTKLAYDFDIDEIIVSCMAFSYEDRRRSFELLAEAFELKSNIEVLIA